MELMRSITFSNGMNLIQLMVNPLGAKRRIFIRSRRRKNSNQISLL